MCCKLTPNLFSLSTIYHYLYVIKEGNRIELDLFHSSGNTSHHLCYNNLDSFMYMLRRSITH